MKQLSKILFLIMLSVAVMYGGEMSAQINVNKLKDKAKNKVKKKDKDKDKKQDDNSNENVENDTKKDKNNQNTTKKLTFDSNNPVRVEYESFFKSFILNEETGELKIEEFQMKNLPIASYGLREDDHKLTAVLKLEDKVLVEFPLKGKSEYSALTWDYIVSEKIDYKEKTYTISDGGNYSIDFQIDEKSVDKIDFNIVKVTKGNATGFFFNKPYNTIGMIHPKEFSKNYDSELHKSIIKPETSSAFIFEYYDAEFKPEGGINEYVIQSIRLLRVNPNGKDVYLGGTYEDEYASPNRMKTDKYFFKLPNEDYKYVTFDDVINVNGKYYIDLIAGAEHFKYNFEVKNKTIITSIKNRAQNGSYWIERESVGYPKYDGFKPTLPIAGKKDNIRMSVAKPDGGSQGFDVSKHITFSDGKIISPSISLSNEIKDKYRYRFTEFVVTLMEGDKIIAQHINADVFISKLEFVWLMQDRTEKGEIYQRYNTGVFMDALAKLSAGNHKVKFIWEMSSGDDADIVAIRTVTFASKNGNPKFTKWAEETEELLLLSRTEMQDLAYSTSSSNDYVYYLNNCGRTVWVRQDGVTEYYIYPGKQIKFNRARGYIEQWNFGTLKWKDTDDFNAYKSIYKLDNIALFDLKIKQPEWAEKLTPLQDKIFNTEDAYVKEVVKLIGQETFDEYRNLILQAANIDFVKICQ